MRACLGLSVRAPDSLAAGYSRWGRAPATARPPRGRPLIVRVLGRGFQSLSSFESSSPVQQEWQVWLTVGWVVVWGEAPAPAGQAGFPEQRLVVVLGLLCGAGARFWPRGVVRVPAVPQLLVFVVDRQQEVLRLRFGPGSPAGRFAAPLGCYGAGAMACVQRFGLCGLPLSTSAPRAATAMVEFFDRRM